MGIPAIFDPWLRPLFLPEGSIVSSTSMVVLTEDDYAAKPLVQKRSSLPPGTGAGACMKRCASNRDDRVCQPAGRRIR